MANWISKAAIYHIFTLGFCGAEENNDTLLVQNRIGKVLEWTPHLKNLGVNTLLFSPLFEASSHGYDTADYYKLDKRLGTNEDFKAVCDKLHESGFKIILDGVFNHVGRDFWAFKDLLQHKQESRYKDWFCNVNFGGSTPYGDPFSYDAWEGHYNLVKLNVWNQEVRDYLFGAIKMWVETFDIDGLRLDVAYCIDQGFLKALRSFTEELKPDFWLMGEMIHGDYKRLVSKELLHSTTNYECYKGIYSSHNDKNYFEINYSLNRLFGKGGLCEGIGLYNFVDNHDVERIGSILKNKAHIKNVYTLLFTMPGVPSIYYGSEWAIEGKKEKGSDNSLRPCLDLEEMLQKDQELVEHIRKLATIREENEILQAGGFEQVVVRNQQLIFARNLNGEKVYVALNLQEQEMTLDIKADGDRPLIDLLDMAREEIQAEGGIYKVSIKPYSGMILIKE